MPKRFPPVGPCKRGRLSLANTASTSLAAFPNSTGLSFSTRRCSWGPRALLGKIGRLDLWNQEKHFFTPGNLGFPVFETKIGRIGLLVCWDIWFPETARLVAQQGADIICVPTGWVWIRVRSEMQAGFACRPT